MGLIICSITPCFRPSSVGQHSMVKLSFHEKKQIFRIKRRRIVPFFFLKKFLIRLDGLYNWIFSLIGLIWFDILLGILMSFGFFSIKVLKKIARKDGIILKRLDNHWIDINTPFFTMSRQQSIVDMFPTTVSTPGWTTFCSHNRFSLMDGRSKGCWEREVD